MDKIKKDINLREAVSRMEQKMPPMPSDLNERLLRSLTASPSQHRRSPLLWRGWGRLAAAAVLVAVVTLFTWKNHTSEPELSNIGQKAEVVVAQSQNAPQENTPKVIEEIDVPNEPTKHVKLANETREVRQLGEPRLKGLQPARKDIKPAKETNIPVEQPVLAEAEPQLEDDVPVIPADKQALADIFLAEEALQVVYELRAQQEEFRAYAASLTGEEPAKVIIAF